jgi:hypothetical protein
VDVLNKYIHAAKDAVIAVSNGQDMRRELALLEPLESELRAAIALLTKRPDPVKAAAAHSQSTWRQRLTQRFLLTYSGGGTETITSWEALAKRIRLKESSIRVMLSKGKGRFSIRRLNPTIGADDMLTVARVDECGEIIPAKMGRPRTRAFTEAEVAELNGTLIAESARTVPKETNRRRATKP